MKNITKLVILAILFVIIFSSARAVSILTVPEGGTGSGSFAKYPLVGNGTDSFVASSTLWVQSINTTSVVVPSTFQGISASTINLPKTNKNGTVGVISFGGVPFIHNYATSSSVGQNTFVGNYAGNFTIGDRLSSNNGSYNTGIGWAALYRSTTGFNNTAIGHHSLQYNTTGYSNSALGVHSLNANTSGAENVSVGGGALFYNTSGNDNTALGTHALFYNTTGHHNISIGYNSAFGDNTNFNNKSVIDSNSNFIGTYASRDASVSSTTALFNATAIGYRATVGASNSLVLGGTGANSVKVGIGTPVPTQSLSVFGGNAIINSGSLCVKNDNNPCIGSLAGTIYANNIILQSAGKISNVGGSWSIDDSGKIVAKNIETDTISIKYGATIMDTDTGAPFCITVKSGVLQTTAGACSAH